MGPFPTAARGRLRRGDTAGPARPGLRDGDSADRSVGRYSQGARGIPAIGCCRMRRRPQAPNLRRRRLPLGETSSKKITIRFNLQSCTDRDRRDLSESILPWNI
ncbi:hypothetical protein PAHAL_3G104000 [Panicum hallii]|uniref:Uncharacterized protein n=1 Tax=Panicum hallii TaxID=206008 RepID=A0A2S3H7N8_9POAL|nr:hypothetical protein PAHAL_3G104000 [Panicum hallii]